MGQRLAELHQGIVDYATAFDPARLNRDDLGTALRLATAIEHASATIKALEHGTGGDTAGDRRR
jgi:hypothetical protein